MKFSRLFESKEVEDMTHEVLTGHGLGGPTSGQYWQNVYPHEGLEKGKHHEDLRSIGWRKSDEYEDHEDEHDGLDPGEWIHTKTKVYSHPGHHKDLHVSDSDSDQGPHHFTKYEAKE